MKVFAQDRLLQVYRNYFL